MEISDAGESPTATRVAPLVSLPYYFKSHFGIRGQGHVVAGASPALRWCYSQLMLRKYDYRGRYLPHLQKDNKALFITFTTYRRWPLPSTARDVTLEACSHVHGKKCCLHAAVVMPDHVYLICTMLTDESGPFSVADIMQAVKSESAHRINRVLGRQGKVWQDESFDHVLRSGERLEEKIAYVLQNPVRAGLAGTSGEYRWIWPRPNGDI